jgi:hypothetical protein
MAHRRTDLWELVLASSTEKSVVVENMILLGKYRRMCLKGWILQKGIPVDVQTGGEEMVLLRDVAQRLITTMAAMWALWLCEACGCARHVDV